MKKVLLRFYSANNLGDDLFIKIITERYANQFTLYTSIRNSSLERISNLHTISRSPTFFSILTIFGRIFSLRYPWLRYAAKKNDLLVYIGGSLFMDKHGTKPWRRESTFYRQYPLPYYILGSNVGPYKSKEVLKIFENIFRGAKDVCLRDKASYEYYRHMTNVRHGGDIVFTLDTSLIETKNSKTAIFSVMDCSNHFNADTTLQYEVAIDKMTKNLLERGYRIIYMSFCEAQGDDIAIERILSRLPQKTKQQIKTFFYKDDIDEALTLIAESDIIIGTRFHAVILGLLFGKRVLPLTYSKKTTNILSDINFKGAIVDIGEIHTFPSATFDFSTLQKNDIQKQIKLAELQFQELDKVLVKREHE